MGPPIISIFAAYVNPVNIFVRNVAMCGCRDAATFFANKVIFVNRKIAKITVTNLAFGLATRLCFRL
jgi:hypothetical protein